MKFRFAFSFAVVALLSTQDVFAVSFEKTFVAATVESATKGIAFPIHGQENQPPSFVSVRVFRWVGWKNSEPVTEATKDFLVFPQLVRMSGGARRAVRLKMREDAKPPSHDSFYRIVIEEFDRPYGEDSIAGSESNGVGLRVRPTVSVPFVLHGSGIAKAATSCQESFDTKVIRTNVNGFKSELQTVVALTNKSMHLGRVSWVGDPRGLKGKAALEYSMPGETVEIPVENFSQDDAKAIRLDWFQPDGEDPVGCTLEIRG